jgi:flagellar M-ring protein FliF
VHVAMPQEKLFETDTAPTTASVLVETSPGATLGSGQVQAVIHLVASSVEALDPKQVTVTDSTGQVLSAAGDDAGTVGDARAQQVEDFEKRMGRSVTSVLDRVLGSGNSAVQVTADLNFDQTTTQTTRYFTEPGSVPLTDTTMTEKYTAPGAGGPNGGGVVGPDGQLDPDAARNGATAYEKKQRTADNAVNQTVEQREAAPGNVQSLHMGVVVDTRALAGINLADVEALVTSAVGIDPERGDTVEVTTMPFDRTGEEEAKAALAAAKKADEKAELMSMAKTGGLVLLLLLVLLAAWRQSRKRSQLREQATTYVVEQIRRNNEAVEAAPVAAELPTGEMAELKMAARDEIAAIVERQPEDVAQLLRGWLVEADR